MKSYVERNNKIRTYIARQFCTIYETAGLLKLRQIHNRRVPLAPAATPILHCGLNKCSQTQHGNIQSTDKRHLQVQVKIAPSPFEPNIQSDSHSKISQISSRVAALAPS